MAVCAFEEASQVIKRRIQFSYRDVSQAGFEVYDRSCLFEDPSSRHRFSTGRILQGEIGVDMKVTKALF